MSSIPKAILSLETYERRAAFHKAELELKKQITIEKLIAMGVSEEEINSLTAE